MRPGGITLREGVVIAACDADVWRNNFVAVVSSGSGISRRMPVDMATECCGGRVQDVMARGDRECRMLWRERREHRPFILVGTIILYSFGI